MEVVSEDLEEPAGPCFPFLSLDEFLALLGITLIYNFLNLLKIGLTFLLKTYFATYLKITSVILGLLPLLLGLFP